MALTEAQTALSAAALRQRLTTLWREVREELAQHGGQHYADLAGSVADLGDRSVAGVLADQGAALIDRQVREARATEAALARLATGGYGGCIACGATIDLRGCKRIPPPSVATVARRGAKRPSRTRGSRRFSHGAGQCGLSRWRHGISSGCRRPGERRRS